MTDHVYLSVSSKAFYKKVRRERRGRGVAGGGREGEGRGGSGEGGGRSERVG